MVTINGIDAYEVLDSRGNPTVCVRTVLSDGSVGSSIVPSGASTGKKEALEMRDKDSRYFGRGVRIACNNVRNSIAAELVGMCPFDQAGLDGLLKQLDDTEGYSSLGANAVLGVSISVARASSRSLNIPLYRYIGGINARFLPTPMLNIINGGAHANNRVDFQEYMVMPVGFSSFADAMRASAEIYHCLKEILSDAGLSTGVGDEGGFSPDLKNNEEPIEYILRAVERSGYKGGDDVFIAIDVASSELFENGLYNLRGEGRQLDSAGMIDYYQGLVAKYPILSIEDGLSEDDWEGWKSLTRSLGSRIQLVGDDLFVTNENILRRGIDDGIGNAILIKPNQIGTLTETMNAVQLAHLNGYNTIASHRSGDSEDSFIADLAIALSSFQIKTGAPARGERNAKYNRLLEIEHFDSGVSYSAKSEFNKLTR